ncbi:MAG TPA: phage tail tape measure protein [Syntrophomonadaceae bacterium]|nr:phage tail tape measure protein [Syntrophomonadaceae bacterium]
MPASTSMTVALVLTAVNNMPSVLNTAGRNIQSFASQISKAGNEVYRYDQKIKDFEGSITRFNKIKTSGMQDIQSGMVMMIPVEETLRQAGQFESVVKKVENALYDSTLPATTLQEQMKGLTAEAVKLGNQTTFNNTEAAQAELELVRNGMTYKDVLEGGATAAMYLAQTAEIAPSVSADAVSQVTNMFQLQGNQLLQVADDINRAANASSAGVVNIMNDLQQAGMSAHVLGLEVKDTTLMLGVLHNMGLGESSGSYLNDMLVNLDKVTPKARKALDAMGWLEGATVKTMKSGAIKVTGGTNSLFDEQGQIRSAEMLVQKLRGVLYNNSGIKPEDMRDQFGNLLPQDEIERILAAKNKLEALQELKDVFGIQGMRAAIALSTAGKGSYEEMVTQANRAMSIQEQVLNWQETMLGKWETMEGSWQTMVTQTGSPMTNEVGEMTKKVTDLINSLGKWSNENPKLAAGIIKIIGLGAGFRILWGAGKVAIGGIGSIISKIGQVLAYVTPKVLGFYDAFKYFRSGSEAAGFFRSIWQAIAFGSPVLTRITGLLSRLGGAGKVLGPLGYLALTAGTVRSAYIGDVNATARGTGGILGGITAGAAAGSFAGPIGTAVGAILGGILGEEAFGQLMKNADKWSAALFNWGQGVGKWLSNGLNSSGVTNTLDTVATWFSGWGDKIGEKLNSLISGSSIIRDLDSFAGKIAYVGSVISGWLNNLNPFNNSNPEHYTEKPKVVTADNSKDNRQYTFHIQSTDPKSAANEVVQKITGSSGMDKYIASRDPRLQPAY